MTNDNKIKKSPIKITKPIADLSQVEWLPLSEVASLIEKSSSSIREAINERNGKHTDGCYQWRKTGRNYEILLSSIPNNAQNEYRIQQLDALKTQPEPAHSVKLATAPTLEFAYYDALFNDYSRKPASIKAEAERRLSILDELTALLQLKTSKGNAEAMIKSRYPDASKTTLWRWHNKVKNHPRDYWLALLAPEHEGKQRNEIPQAAWDYFIQHYLSEAQPAAIVIYRQTLKAAVANAWGEIPSVKTFQRRIDSDIHEDVLILGRKGKTTLKESLPHATQDYTKRPIHHTWEADGRKCDVWVKMPNGEVCRPWLCVFRELRTRMIIGFKLGISNDAYLVTAALKDAFMRTETRPDYFHFDNGTEYSNYLLTGGQKSKVRRQDEANHAIGALTRMGIKVKWATPRHGAAKSIESGWNGYAKNVDQTFTKAYVGRNPVERPESSHKKHAIDFDIYAQAIENHIVAFCKGEYCQHRGQGMDGKSPYELFNELKKGHVHRTVTRFELDAMRPIYNRVLDVKLSFKIKIKDYGELEYVARDNSQLKRGFTYQVLPDPYDYNAPAMIYEGSKLMGEAEIKHAIDYSIDHGDNAEQVKRQRTIKQTAAQLKRLKGEGRELKLLTNEILLLPKAEHPLLVNKPAKPTAEYNPIERLADGTIYNHLTNERVTPLPREIMPLTENNTHQTIQSELEEKRKNKAYLDAPDWQKQILDPMRYTKEQAEAKENAHPENARLSNTKNN